MKIVGAVSLLLISGLILWQLLLHRQLSENVVSCEGDWSYNVICPVGSTCKSLNEGPLAGGVCSPYLIPVSVE